MTSSGIWSSTQRGNVGAASRLTESFTREPYQKLLSSARIVYHVTALAKKGEIAMDIAIDVVLIMAAIGLGFVLYKLNTAIRILNNRVNIISHTQSTMIREMKSRMDATIEGQSSREAELRKRLERDFR